VNLYLDDVRNPPDDSWTLVRTAEEARTIIASGVVECASLDHDLGECEECTAARGYQSATVTCRHRMTGYDLVKWMAETGVGRSGSQSATAATRWAGPTSLR